MTNDELRNQMKFSEFSNKRGIFLILFEKNSPTPRFFTYKNDKKKVPIPRFFTYLYKMEITSQLHVYFNSTLIRELRVGIGYIFFMKIRHSTFTNLPHRCTCSLFLEFSIEYFLNITQIK